MKRYRRGYTQGVFDLFHIGHLNLLTQAKARCDYLLVGVNSDSLVRHYKNKTTIIPEGERCSIIAALRAVDEVFLCDSLDKREIWEQHPFDVLFIGSDWKGHPRWTETERLLAPLGIDVVYLPHTEGISSSLIREHIGR